MVILRNVLALLLGLAVGAGVNMGIVVGGAGIVPPPPGVDVSDASSIAESIHLFEPRHFVVPFLAHSIGTLVGALLAYLIAASYRAAFAYAVGVVTLAGGIAAAVMIPAPAWFIALDLLVAYIPAAWIATRIGARIVPRIA